MEGNLSMVKLLTTVLATATAVVMLCACTKSGTTGGGGNPNNPSSSAPSPVVPSKAAPAKPKYTVNEQQAITSAEQYLAEDSGFSRAGLLDQLTSEAGEGFKKADAEFALAHIKVDYNAQAVLSAKGYLQQGGFSRASLIEQLSSADGEHFTKAQAIYAANKVGLK